MKQGRCQVKKPTKEKWLQDVANTEREAKANALISEGYDILADLPQTEAAYNSLFTQRAKYFKRNSRKAETFLNELKAYGEKWGYVEKKPAGSDEALEEFLQ